jgi:hypothetical protein
MESALILRELERWGPERRVGRRTRCVVEDTGSKSTSTSKSPLFAQRAREKWGTRLGQVQRCRGFKELKTLNSHASRETCCAK